MSLEIRRGRWEEAADWPLTGAAVVFLVAYALPILKPELSATVRDSCRAATWATWGLFAVDYAARLALSEQRLKFVRSNLLDLAVVALPLLRPLRLLRLVTLLSVQPVRGRLAARARGGVCRGGDVPCAVRVVVGNP